MTRQIERKPLERGESISLVAGDANFISASMGKMSNAIKALSVFRLKNCLSKYSNEYELDKSDCKFLVK